MSWHFSQALAEEFSRLGCLDGARCALLKSMRTAEKSSLDARKKAIWKRFQSGMMYDRSTATDGVEKWISSLPDSRANHSALPEEGGPATTNETCGRPPFAFLSKSSQHGRYWKTCRGYSRKATDTSKWFSETWPNSGSMRNGVCYQRPELELRICASDSGYLPTPQASDHTSNVGGNQGRIGRERFTLNGMARFGMWPTLRAKESGNYQRDKGTKGKERPTLAGAVILWPTPQSHDATPGNSKRVGRFRGKAGGRNLNDEAALHSGVETGLLNPTWVEWLMGWPTDWTALEALGTDKFLVWQREHGLN